MRSDDAHRWEALRCVRVQTSTSVGEVHPTITILVQPPPVALLASRLHAYRPLLLPSDPPPRLDHVHVMERGKSYLLVALEDED